MRNAFPFPLPQSALDEFRHPAEWHPLHLAHRHEGEILAANGYIAIRARKGGWIDEEFPPAPASYLERFEKLPWHRFKNMPDEWRVMDHQRGRLFHHGRIGMWLDGAVAPSPVWRVNDTVNVRLSILQLVAMLPRAEVFTGQQDHQDPLFFTFSGGMGIAARDKRLTLHSATLFSPERDCFSGRRMGKRTVFQGSPPSNPNWPPPDLSDV